jgi:hypothetical protein
MHKSAAKTLGKIVVVLTFWVSCCAAALAAGRYGDILVQISPAVSSGGESSIGYADYQVTITNSGSVEHTVELIMPRRTTQGYGNHLRQMTRKVAVLPGSTAVVSLFQPPLRMYGDDVQVIIDGRYQRDSLALMTIRHAQDIAWAQRGSHCLLVSRQVGFDDVNKGLQSETGSTAVMPGMGGYSSGMGFNIALSEFPVSQWSQNWLSYSRYSGILLSGEEWSAAPAGVRRAMMEYVRCGGSLLIIGRFAGGDEVFAFEKTEAFFRIADRGLGRPSPQIAPWLASGQQIGLGNRKKLLEGRAGNLQSPKSVKEANDWFPVIDNLTIPVRGLFLIVLLFALLIGAANLFILTRKKRQLWLFWTVPLMSLIASLIVFAYASFAEGWRGHSRILSLTILDESETLATTIAISAFYCPLNPREGLHFDYETECVPQIGHNYYHDGGTGRTIDWSRDQHLASGWVTSRVPAHFLLRKSQMRREKIVFSTGSSGPYDALNGFGIPIEALYYADADGAVYYTGTAARHQAENAAKNLDRP